MSSRLSLLAVALLVTACASDPNVIRYGDIVCDREPKPGKQMRECWPADSAVERQKREERFGK